MSAAASSRTQKTWNQFQPDETESKPENPVLSLRKFENGQAPTVLPESLDDQDVGIDDTEFTQSSNTILSSEPPLVRPLDRQSLVKEWSEVSSAAAGDEDEQQPADLALLDLLPSFSPYEYPDKPLSVGGNNSTLESPAPKGNANDGGTSQNTLDQTVRDFLLDLASHRRPAGSSEITGLASDIDDRLLFDLKLKFITPLRDIFHLGENLLKAELKVEDTYRQLAELRDDMREHINLMIHLSASASFRNESVHRAFHKSGRALNKALKKTEIEERDLVTRQRQVTLSHSNLKGSINELYGALLDGRQVGDSQQNLEDEIFVEFAASKSHVHSTSTSSSALYTEMPKPTASAGIDSTQDLHGEDATPGIHNIAADGNKNLNHAQSLRIVPALKTVTPRKLLIQSKKGQPSPPTELHCIGYCFRDVHISDDDLTSMHDLEDIPEIIKEIRDTDLLPELSIDVRAYRNISPEAGDRVAVLQRRNIQQRYNDYSAARLHRRDWTAMWGSDMSCNAFSDLIKTILYDAPEWYEYRTALWDIEGLSNLLEDVKWPRSESGLVRVKFLADTIRGICLNTHPIALPLPSRFFTSSLRNNPSGLGSVVRHNSPRSDRVEISSGTALAHHNNLVEQSSTSFSASRSNAASRASSARLSANSVSHGR